jgi:hypothetical protein
MPTFVRLEAGNDWGHVYFALPGKAKTAHGTCSSSLGLALPPGREVRVRWPDGSESVETIATKSFRVDVGDMGHNYSFTDERPGFLVTTRGVRNWISIGDVDVAQEDVT